MTDRLDAALTALEQDKLLAEALGDRFTEVVTALKRQELARFRRAVTDWEFPAYSRILRPASTTL
ncbi:hypothetical protein [Streptomyces sp. NEAU-NA10]|uniref:hypothetical protein n=1 Tax=Streptomyces sp. NEAU-NA10 TaxID=3416050 RepID=UPI003CC6369F